MKKTLLFFVSLLFLCSCPSAAFAQSTGVPTDPYADDHIVLREMLGQIEKAINERRYDDIAQFLAPDANVIFENAEVADGAPAVVAFYKKLFVGDSAILRGIQTKALVGKPAEFYGNAAVAYGTVDNHITLIDGTQLNLTSRWSTTLTKENGQWKIVSLQFTANVFDNPLLAKVVSTTKYVGGGTLVLGLLLGFWVGRYVGKKSVVLQQNS